MTLKLLYAGFNYVADVDGSYADANSLSTMISETDSNAVALTDDFAINAQTSTVYADASTNSTTGITETIAHLTPTIQSAESQHLSVLVRPLIDFSYNESSAQLDNGTYYDGLWRAEYEPANTATFFSSYQSMVVAEATAAQAGGAQIFDIGTELDQLTGPSYLTQWTSIINAVKGVFHGSLTYSAIGDDDLSPWQYGGAHPPVGTGDITTQVSFWNLLNNNDGHPGYIGIDEYEPISAISNGAAGPDPTLNQLIAGWEDAPPPDSETAQMTGGVSLIQYYENVAATLHMPLLFTEIGYNSAPDAAAQPFYTSDSTYDPTLQENLYKAFITAWKADGNTSLEGVYIWNWEPDPTTVGAGSSPNWTPQDNTGALLAIQSGFSAAIACFAEGTGIATPTGRVQVEALQAGMQILNAQGQPRTISWIGHRRLDLRGHPRPLDVQPVRMSAHAFARGQPQRDLLLSPDHAVFVQGVLIPVRYLVNGRSIVQETRRTVRYFHIELETHDILLAENLPAETYLDTGNRGAFANGGPIIQAHPDFARGTWATQACAPLVMEGPALTATRQMLLHRAALLGHRHTTDAGLQILANGRPLTPTIDGPNWRIRLSPGCTKLHLASRSWIPGHMRADEIDTRRLGVAIANLQLDARLLPLTDPHLSSGWHSPEPDWRWTDGDATLAVAGAHELAFAVAMTGTYWLDQEHVAQLTLS